MYNCIVDNIICTVYCLVHYWCTIGPQDADLPHLEPHLLEGVSSLLPPPSLPSSLTAQGDVYHFMHTLFTSTQPHPLTSDL